MMGGEKNSEKSSGFQMGIGPTTDIISDALNSGLLRNLETSRSFVDWQKLTCFLYKRLNTRISLIKQPHSPG